MTHGKIGTYTNHACRCDPCRKAMREYNSARRDTRVDHDALRDLLIELFPDGLTDDAPCRRNRQEQAA